MRFSTTFSVILLLMTAIPFYGTHADKLRFNRDIRPILSHACLPCHGFDSESREAELRLDTFEGATAELDSGDGRAIVPGKPDESVLLQRVLSHNKHERMPPADFGKVLTPKQIETLRKWIKQGAKYERHWSFIAPQSQPLPKVKNTKWPRNMIDHFVLARLETEGLSPSPEADRRTLIRRVAQDVTGLPPTQKEIEQFLRDTSNNAYEKMVDRYLSSRRYGEHMARHWLDLARYADTSGYQYDRERTMWVWRDWVIHAYNQNKPFDKFTVEQLAGDLLPNATPQQILATGFNRNHPITIEGGVIDEEYRTEYVIDRLTTTGTVWMGLTLNCARCHEHKYDPISQEEFYRMSAYFNQVAEKGLNGFNPQQRIASPLAKEQSAEITAKIKKLNRQISELEKSPDQKTFEDWIKSLSKEPRSNWTTLKPEKFESSGGTKLTLQKDLSLLAGGANPGKDAYTISATTNMEKITAVRLECLTHPSLPGGGPGRHSNSNFVLSEFELVAVSVKNEKAKQSIKFVRAVADYNQSNYHVRNAIDGRVQGNKGWAVDGPTRKKQATAIFVPEKPFGFSGGTQLVFRLRHEANFRTHGIGRPRLSVTQDDPSALKPGGLPENILRAANKTAEKRSKVETDQLRKYFANERKKRADIIRAEVAILSLANRYPPTLVMKDLAKPRTTHVLLRGQYNRKGKAVSPGTPESLLALSKNSPKNRLGFAKWLVDSKHPLTSRVAVNRYWQMYFGIGLVKTSEDFGTQGEWPSHPALLDALAVKFVQDGWDIKSILRLMLTSAAYRQSSRVTEKLRKLDPENRLLARGPRFRLDAEQIRDQALAISGLLKSKIGGPSVYPYQPKGLWLELNNRPGFSRAYTKGKGDALYRRSIYTFWKRTVLSPMLKTLDAPGREFCTVRRSRTNTPLQALLLLQSPQYVEASRHLSVRMLKEGGKTVEARIAFGFQLATARKPTANEAKVLQAFLNDRLDFFKKDKKAALKMLSVGDSAIDEKLDAAEHAAWMELARLILNLDETLTKG